jgi:hypothetical protein
MPDGITYQLPHAEYFSHGNLNGSDVRQLAIGAAKTVWKNFAVIVTATNEPVYVDNLKPIPVHA